MNHDFIGVERPDEAVHHDTIFLPEEYPHKPSKLPGKPNYPTTRCFKSKKVDKKQK